MHLRLTFLFAAFSAFYPTVSKAAVLYALSVDYSNINGNPAGSTLNWVFETPSILTTETTVTSFLSSSIGSGFSSFGGSCGTVVSASILAPPNLKPPIGPLGLFLNHHLVGFVRSRKSIHWRGSAISDCPGYAWCFRCLRTQRRRVPRNTIANLTDIQGGTTSTPVFLNVPELAEIDGTIGGQGTQDYYTIDWRGGTFSATAVIAGSGAHPIFFQKAWPVAAVVALAQR
ncbi:MAG: hypothetical protein P4L56_12040 [Candidatus Sulfopaludibacter sp.]|nr:hypothetical protein [Candidatus Sulfopaludibacter sp.]